ncbi:MBL fold metallo-hydrolase [Acuticoccus sediminis]|uniref:MBL fold metallo-hydrolase n=1 Tax=Acuticoccus sediminis TaxID=2184697 RepID=A0A8B2NJA3_9HYPH|nr:MBL fold metallo-hydrolase [Acuticoccus sediminis]RAH97310.1 MBL fold metallo-hydrolase [Acuticoccus sediminis]
MPPLDLGRITVHPLIDAVPDPVAVTWSFPAVDAAEWASVTLPGLDPAGRFQPSLGAFLVTIGATRVLCDAGIGRGPNAYLGGLEGRLPPLLAAAGLTTDDVDAVVFTHLHMDHVGWASDGGAPVFGRARYFVPAADAAFFAAGAPGMGAHHAEAFEASIRPLIAAGRVTPLAGGAEILPGVSYRATPGHTPGHQAILFTADGRTLAVCGDVFHAPAQVERPDWSHRADHDAARARISRRAFIDAAAREGWILAAGHFRDGLQFGRIAAGPDRALWRPLATDGHDGGPAARAADLTTGG